MSHATSTNLGKPPLPLSQDVTDPDTCTESRSPSKSKSTSRNVVPTLPESKHCNKDPFKLCKNSFFSRQWANRRSLPRVRKQREITGIRRILNRSGEKDLSLVNRTKCSSKQATPLLEHTNWLLNATEVRAPEGDPQGRPHTVQQSFLKLSRSGSSLPPSHVSSLLRTGSPWFLFLTVLPSHPI